jgi:hypothetical protein
MSDVPDKGGARLADVRYALIFMLVLGVALIVWGIVGPVGTGAAFAEMAVERLGLQKEPETYTTLAMLYAEQIAGHGFADIMLGLLIVFPSGLGLWAIHKARRDSP